MFHKWTSTDVDTCDQCMICGTAVEFPADRLESVVIRIEDIRSIVPCPGVHDGPSHHFEFDGVDAEGFDSGTCYRCGTHVDAETVPDSVPVDCIEI